MLKQLQRMFPWTTAAVRAMAMPMTVTVTPGSLMPRLRTDGALTEIMPPFGTNPPQMPVAGMPDDYSSRLITNDPRELWYLALPYKLTPNQVITILRSALGGDLWQQWQLLSLMMDSWPMLRKCSMELRDGASGTRYAVRPYCEDGEEPTPIALDKASLVRRGFAGMRPNQFTDEQGIYGTIYDLSDSLLNGLTMNEVLWERRISPKYGAEIMPRATAWVHPRHYTFSNDGLIAVFDANYTRMYSALADQQNMNTPDPNKFIVAQFKSRSGSSLGAGLIRPLAWAWSAKIFNQEWMLNTAMKFGGPFIDASTGSTLSASDKAELDNMLANAANNRYCRHDKAVTIDVKPAQSLGADNPQRHLDERADSHCCILLLGQEGSTMETPGKLGNSDGKDDVKRERVEALARWLATEPLTQLARAIIRMNYGNEDDIPIIEPDYTEAPDPMAQAQRDQVFIQAGVPMVAEEFYKANGMTMPQQGDLVLKGGAIGNMAAPQKDLGAPEPEPLPGQAGLPGAKDDTEPVQSRRRGFDYNAALNVATEADLQELETLLVAAESAPHTNGELKAVKAKLKSIYGQRIS